jgi:uncharacterized protein
MNLILTAKKQKIRELTIYVESGIGSCPFACEYCFVAKRGEHRVMTRQTLMDCVDFLRRVCEKPKALRFFGTEPLTQFGLIQHARAYAPDLEISITTNGWLLDDDRIQWLADNGVRIYVYSIDGGPEHHKKRVTVAGKPTWERVAANFQKLLPTQGKWITARGTWDGSDYDLLGRFKALEAIGAGSIQIVPAIGLQCWDEAKVARAYMGLADYYKGGDCPSRFIKQALVRLESGDSRYQGNKCGMGKHAWGVTPTGDLCLCHNEIEMDDWRIGSIYDSSVNEHAILLSDRVDKFRPNMPECKRCHARVLCMGVGWCAAENLRYGGDVIKPPTGYCVHLRGFATGMRYWLSLRHTSRIRQWLIA